MNYIYLNTTLVKIKLKTQNILDFTKTNLNTTIVKVKLVQMGKYI